MDGSEVRKEKGVPSEFKSGYVAIVGKPNVGKSTILNYLLGRRLAIVTPKPETTRNRMLGILNLKNGQIIFLDTPGVHIPHTLLGRYMVKEAKGALFEVDLVLAVIDAKSEIDKNDKALFDLLGDVKKDVLLLINKIDLIDRRFLLPLIENCAKIGIFKEYIPISATGGDNMELLIPKILECLPEGPKYFPGDYLTDKPESFFVAEMVREQVLNFTRQEIPHSVAVLVEQIEPRPNKDLTFIQATVIVERDSQKAIIIGRKGQMLKTIGEAARKQIEGYLKAKVYLDLWVKVYRNWRKDQRVLKLLGYS